MMSLVQPLLAKRNVLAHTNEEITVATIKNQDEAVSLITELLYTVVDRKTVLYLSGGKTPKELYARIAREETLIAGCVGQVDERYGMPFHENSNQKMIAETELLRYLQIRDIRFYPMLQIEKSREETAEMYDQTVRSLNATLQRSVAILGIGADGHTAGIPAVNLKRKTNNAKLYNTYDFVTEYNDTSGIYGERVTMTFLGLSMLDILIVVVLGEDKKEALEKMFIGGSEEEIPARFYKRPEIAKKTIIITDQHV